MNADLKSALVKIYGSNECIGNGFVMAGGLIVTCAHVLRDAIDSDSVDAEIICNANFKVEFHWVNGKPLVTARLAPQGLCYDGYGRDVAFLCTEQLPIESSQYLNLTKHPSVTCPVIITPYFPSLESSVSINAAAAGMDEHGRLVIKPKNHKAQFVEAGNSGAPVFAENSETVEAIISSVDLHGKQAFCCSAQSINSALNQMLLPVASNVGITMSTGFINKSILIDDLLGKDPVKSNRAYLELANKGVSSLFDVLLKNQRSTLQYYQIPKLAAQFGDESVEVLKSCIAEQDWHVKVMAAHCFSGLSDSNSTPAAIYELLESKDFDVLRNAITAAGVSGYIQRVIPEVEDLTLRGEMHSNHIVEIDKYAFRKLAGTTVDALMHGYALNGEYQLLDSAINIGNKIPVNRAPGRDELLERCFPTLCPAAVDHIVAKWLNQATDRKLSFLALKAIGTSRYERFGRTLIEILGHQEEEFSMAAGFALANIGGERAAKFLLDFMSTGDDMSSVEFPFSVLYHHDLDWPDCSQLVTRLLSENSEVSAQLTLSIGLKGETAYYTLVKKKFEESSDSLNRSAAALAMALLNPTESRGMLRGFHSEASTKTEAILLLVAQIFSGIEDLTDDLHAELVSAEHWHLKIIRPFWSQLIITAFRLQESAITYSAVWAPYLNLHTETSKRQIDSLLSSVRT